MAISTNQKPTIYRKLFENTGPGCFRQVMCFCWSGSIQLTKPKKLSWEKRSCIFHKWRYKLKVNGQVFLIISPSNWIHYLILDNFRYNVIGGGRDKPNGQSWRRGRRECKRIHRDVCLHTSSPTRSHRRVSWPSLCPLLSHHLACRAVPHVGGQMARIHCEAAAPFTRCLPPTTCSFVIVIKMLSARGTAKLFFSDRF